MRLLMTLLLRRMMRTVMVVVVGVLDGRWMVTRIVMMWLRLLRRHHAVHDVLRTMHRRINDVRLLTVERGRRRCGRHLSVEHGHVRRDGHRRIDEATASHIVVLVVSSRIAESKATIRMDSMVCWHAVLVQQIVVDLLAAVVVVVHVRTGRLLCVLLCYSVVR